jgi:hypothetical protein
MGERKQLRWMHWSWGKMALVGSWAVVGGLAFYLGRVCLQPQATASPAQPAHAQAQQQPVVPEVSAEYTRNAVAYIHGTMPITREELGEYLIARQGAERLDLLINRRIIDVACKQAGVEVSAQEVEAALGQDLEYFKCDAKQFANNVLKQYGKTLFEWKEDVVRPKLMLNKLCRARVTVQEEDLQKCFEAKYGEKVEGRIILWPHAEKEIAMKMYPRLRESEENFAQAAREQANGRLAATGGKINPVGRNTTGCPDLERAAFLLQPGMMTELIGTPEGVVVFKCDKRIPADTSKQFETERPHLEQEVFLRKTGMEVGKYFEELRAQAKPVNMIRQEPPSPADSVREAEQTLQQEGIPLPKMGMPVPSKGGPPMPGQ